MESERSASVDIEFVKESLDKVVHLSDIESQNDPEDNPYRSKYAAREIMEEIRQKLKKYLDSSDANRIDAERPPVSTAQDATAATSDVNLDEVQLNFEGLHVSNEQKVELFLRFIEGKLGTNFIECDETSSGEEHISQALSKIEASFKLSEPAAVYVVQFLLNQLGILHASRRQNDKAAAVLHKAEAVYTDYKQQYTIAPLSPTDLLVVFPGGFEEYNDDAKWQQFEAEHTQTLFYLAQVYQKSDKPEKSAHYCQETLKRQLEMKMYEPAVWSLHAAALSQYFVTIEAFTLARHYLASAMKIFEEVGTVEFNEEEGSLYNKLIDMKRCWIKYGLNLLEASFNRLTTEQSTADQSSENLPKKEDMFDLELTLYENWITDQYVLDFEQARLVFLKVKDLILEARKFYTFDGWCTDYVELTQDYSKLFKVLSLFEFEPEKRSKMHKRRIDMLEELAKELNPQFYLLVRRQVVYEQGECYYEMIDCKEEQLQHADDTQSRAHYALKITELSKKSIHKFLDYISSLKTPEGIMPDPFPPGDERPVLVAWFRIANLYNKHMKTPDPVEQIKNMQSCKKYFELIVEHCEKHAHYADLMKLELPLCKEMVQLLPHKLDRMVREAKDRGLIL